jgi:hypothetical protein
VLQSIITISSYIVTQSNSASFVSFNLFLYLRSTSAIDDQETPRTGSWRMSPGVKFYSCPPGVIKWGIVAKDALRGVVPDDTF